VAAEPTVESDSQTALSTHCPGWAMSSVAGCRLSERRFDRPAAETVRRCGAVETIPIASIVPVVRVRSPIPMGS